MKRNLLLSLFFVLSFSLNTTIGQKMDNANLEKIIYVMSDTMRGQTGAWEFFVQDIPMVCVTDQNNNRMRIISPIKQAIELTDEEKDSILEANFHSALDVRYAISDDLLWVAYIHPLRELTKEQVIDAISQVYSASVTFGTTYASTSLTFPKNEPENRKF